MVVQLSLVRLTFSTSLQFPAAPFTDSESSCGFPGTREASEPTDEVCFWFSRFLEIKHGDIGFATRGSSLAFFALNFLRHGACLVNVGELVFGVNIFDLDLGAQIGSVANLSNEPLWVLMIILITASLSSERYSWLCTGKNLRLWSHDLDLTNDQCFGHLPSST